MVVFVDLDDTGFDPRTSSHYDSLRHAAGMLSVESGHEDERPNPNINSFSKALGCYPIVVQLAHSLDLNSLHSLSLACRQFRANLLQFRSHLITQTLRCQNEEQSGPSTASQSREPRIPRPDMWNVVGNGHLRTDRTRMTRCKVGRCARDMVEPCRRCGAIVCRNCTTKPPNPTHLLHRHRRLCPTCIAAPLTAHTLPTFLQPDSKTTPAFTTPALERSPCTCPDHFYICIPCGAALVNADTAYSRVWSWRTRYTSSLGGLGTGVGEGVEAVQCARGSACLKARTVEVEHDSGLPSIGAVNSYLSNVTVYSESSEEEDLRPQQQRRREGALRSEERAGYVRQEIEGIGGVVKKKIRARVKVGATVREWEDERGEGTWLKREREGKMRSWCGWCERVIPGNQEVEGNI